MCQAMGQAAGPHLTALEALWWLAAGCSLQSSVGGAAERLLELQACFTHSLHTSTQWQPGSQAAHPPCPPVVAQRFYPPTSRAAFVQGVN